MTAASDWRPVRRRRSGALESMASVVRLPVEVLAVGVARLPIMDASYNMLASQTARNGVFVVLHAPVVCIAHYKAPIFAAPEGDHPSMRVGRLASPLLPGS